MIDGSFWLEHQDLVWYLDAAIAKFDNYGRESTHPHTVGNVLLRADR
jgi:hypothetical protein